MAARALWTALVAAGLAASTAALADHTAYLQRAGPLVQVELGPQGFSGEGLELARDGPRLHGTAYGEVLELTVGADRVEGSLGGRAVDVALSRDGEGLVASGAWAGMPLAIWLSPHAARGYVGSCAYELARTGADYHGSSSCTGAPAPTLLHVPEALTALPPGEQVVVLALLMGSMVGAYEVTAPIPQR